MPSITLINLSESHLITGYAIGLVALLTALLLWSARQAAVYLWCGGGLLQAVAAIAMGIAGEQRPAPLLTSVTVLAATTSLLLKGLAIRALSSTPLRTHAWLAGILAVTVLVGFMEGLAEPPVPVFALLTGATIVYNLLLALVLRRASRELDIGGARLLFWFTLAAAALMAISMVGLMLTGGDAMMTVGKVVPLTGIAVPLLIPIASNALFMRLILDLTLRRSAEEQRMLAAAAVTRSRYEERERLLADIHDGFGSLLATARIRLAHPDTGVREAGRLLDECLHDLQLTVDTLQDDSDSLADDFANLRYRLQQRLAGGGPTLHWKLELNDAPPVSPALRLQVLRVVQEGIGNALKHAQAGNIRVNAAHDPAARRLLITIDDDGLGMPEETRAGRGLYNMQRRARVIGAELDLHGKTAPHTGTRLTLSVPLPGNV